MGPNLAPYFETSQIRTPCPDPPKKTKNENRAVLNRPVIHGGVLPGAPGNTSQRYTQAIPGVSTYNGQCWD